jgi:hypothetical protein
VLGGVVLAAGLLTAAPRPSADDAARRPGRGAAQEVVVGSLRMAAAGVVTMALSGVVVGERIRRQLPATSIWPARRYRGRKSPDQEKGS